MKNPTCGIALLISFFAAAPVLCGAVMDVAVSNSSGNVVYKGKTNSDGSFSTGKLPRGNYVVQFNSRGPAKSSEYAVAVSAGKQRVTANTVAAGKFSGAGVAMRVPVGNEMNIAGSVRDPSEAMAAKDRVVAVDAAALSAAATKLVAGKDGVVRKVKTVNGKRYVWMDNAGTGSNQGGHWVEEGQPNDTRQAWIISNKDVNDIQEHQDQHQEDFKSRTGFQTGRGF